MVFEKLSENIDADAYFNKYKYDESAKKVSVHLRLDPEIANDFVKVIAVYREFGIDKHELIKSELASLIFKEYFDNLKDDESAILDLFSKLKAFRDEIAYKNDAADYYAEDDVSGGVANE